MSEHTMKLAWKRETDDFSYEHYNRSHTWDFGHENLLDASSAPEYKGDAELVDPEQAFVAAMASCHMLTFLAIACKKRYVVDSYEDNPVGILDKNEAGKLAITEVVLSPKVAFSGSNIPDAAALSELHRKAHENCFIASSALTKVTVHPQG